MFSIGEVLFLVGQTLVMLRGLITSAGSLKVGRKLAGTIE